MAPAWALARVGWGSPACQSTRQPPPGAHASTWAWRHRHLKRRRTPSDPWLTKTRCWSPSAVFNSMLLGAPIAPGEKENVYAALQAAQKLEDVITNVVYYSDFERNGYPVSVEAEFGLETEVEAVVSKLAGTAIDHHVYVSVSVDSMVPSRVVGPRQHFGMILRNLVHNAIKFTPPGGHVQVECKMGTDKLPRPRNRELLGPKAGPVRRYLDVCISDTGIGISVKDQARVFRAFEQVAPAASGVADAPGGGSTPLAAAASKLARAMTPRASKAPAGSNVEALAPGLADGVGLGLTLSSVLAEGSQGSVKLVSAPGKGTTVTLRLPVGVVPDQPGTHSLRATLLRGRQVQMAMLGETGDVVAMRVEGVLTSLGVAASKARAKSPATVARLLKREPKAGAAPSYVFVNWAALGGTLASARAALEAAQVPVLLLASPLERALLRSDDGDDDASVSEGGESKGNITIVADALARKMLVVSTPPFSQHRIFRVRRGNAAAHTWHHTAGWLLAPAPSPSRLPRHLLPAPQSLALLARKAMRSASTVSVDASLATSEDSASSLSDGEEVADLSWLRVLIVDDTKVNRMVLKRMMKKLRIRVADTAVNGREGVDMARGECMIVRHRVTWVHPRTGFHPALVRACACADPSGRYDIILMDIMMPVMDGIEATRDLRTNPPQNAPRPVIVAVTASDSVQQAQQAKDAGVDDQVRSVCHQSRATSHAASRGITLTQAVSRLLFA